MAGFVVEPKDIENFLVQPAANNQEGVFFAYEASEEAVKSILPPSFEYVSPVVNGYAVIVQDSSFSAPYMEVALFLDAAYNGEVKPYFLAGAVHGPGTESRMIMGNQAYGLPLKRAEDILVRRQGDRACLSIARRGAVLLEIEIGIGAFNDPEQAATYLGTGEVGVEETVDTWSHKYRAQQQADGTTPFSDVRLVDVTEKVVRETFEPASILSVTAVSTPDDPWGLLAMAKPIGAAYERIAVRQIVSTKVVDTIDTAENMPYLMAGRFDRGLMTKFVNREFRI